MSNHPVPTATAPEAILLSPKHVDTSTYTAPWNWAESGGGKGNGDATMKLLAAKARTAGHSVQWFNGERPIPDTAINNFSWVKVDGHSDTDGVVNIFNQFRA